MDSGEHHSMKWRVQKNMRSIEVISHPLEKFMFNCQKYIFDCQKYIFDCHPPACDYQLRLILVGKSTVGKTSIRSPDHIFQNPGFRRFVALSRQNNRKLLFYQPPPGLWQEKTLTLAEKPQLASTFSPGSSVSEVVRWQDPWNRRFQSNETPSISLVWYSKYSDFLLCIRRGVRSYV